MIPWGRGPPSTFNAQWDNPRQHGALTAMLEGATVGRTNNSRGWQNLPTRSRRGAVEGRVPLRIATGR